jgi:hypothetical protein
MAMRVRVSEYTGVVVDKTQESWTTVDSTKDLFHGVRMEKRSLIGRGTTRS